jgi:putative two-component system response regulator
MRILVAEDQALARLILTSHLSNWGHEVVETADGQEALDYISGAPDEIDMLITDWSMPRLDGLELSQMVRNLYSSSNYIYIILLTSHGEFSDRIRGFAQGGVDDYIVKPFEEAELLHRIKVANRIIMAERQLHLHNQDLEAVVRRQTETIRQTQEEIITRLFSALESRDQETGHHVRRIGVISAKLGGYLGWSQDEVDAIQAAAPLHDVGKIGIQDKVLLKRDRLTEAEWQIIRSHTLIGANILANSQNHIIRLAEMIALRHHENWDGTGYPDGLKGGEIPLVARVVSVADVYDALMADRVYRKGLPEEEVLKILQYECGRKFDPEVGRVFLRNIDDIRNCYKAMEADDISTTDPRPEALEAEGGP